MSEEERTALMKAVEEVDWDATTSERAAEIIIARLSIDGFTVAPHKLSASRVDSLDAALCKVIGFLRDAEGFGQSTYDGWADEAEAALQKSTVGGWSNKELGRQYEKASADHAQEMAKRIAAELMVTQLRSALRLCLDNCIDPTEGEIALTRAREALRKSESQ